MNRLLIALMLVSLKLQSANADIAPGGAAALSIIPGLGQVANGETWEGIGYFTAVAGGIFGGSAASSDFLNTLGTMTYFYQFYDAWRDAGGRPSVKKNIFENYASSYNPLNAIDWIGTPYLALALMSKPGESLSGSNNAWVIGYRSTLAGLGEEAFFRGFLYPGLASFFSNRTVGLIFGSLVSSAIFSYVNLGFNSFTWQEFAIANILCLQLTINNFDLGHNIFLHSWLNIITDAKAASGGLSFSFSF